MTKFEEVRDLWLYGKLSDDEVWDIGMNHEDWDTGCKIRALIIDANEEKGND